MRNTSSKELKNAAKILRKTYGDRININGSIIFMTNTTGKDLQSVRTLLGNFQNDDYSIREIWDHNKRWYEITVMVTSELPKKVTML